MKKIYVIGIGICALIALIGIVIVANEISSGGSIYRSPADDNYRIDYSKQRWSLSMDDPMKYINKDFNFPLLAGAGLISILSISAGALVWKKGDDIYD